jgi:Zn-dependent protease with chaperone function
MTDAQFESLVTRLEPYARAHPASYRRRVIGLALMGDVYLWGVLLALLASVIALVWFIAVLKFVALKLIIVLAPIVWLLGKALWVVVPAPEGVPVKRGDSPGLFALIDDVQRQLNAPAFHHVLIDGDFNAGVVQAPKLGAFGWYTNYLIIGLPLLKSLTPEQFKAVLAHEYGHLAGGHAKLSNWIYRQRRRWSRLLVLLEARGGEGGILFMGFLKRYAPYLNAYSFPLARANEYEADAVAVSLTDARSMAQALTTVNVGGNYLSEKFWPDVYREASRVPAPEKTPYLKFSAQLHADESNLPRERWMQQAMQQSTSTADTHPALADRLLAIGASPELMTPEPGLSADQLLGAALDAITARLDADWSRRVEAGWRERFDQSSRDRDTLAAFDARRANGETLEFDDDFNRALLLDHASDDVPASITALHCLHDARPDAANVAIALGTRLLFLEDESGIPILAAVVEREPAHAIVCGQAMYDFYRRHGRTEDAELLAKRINECAAIQREADEERNAVRPSDSFISHGLSETALADLKRQFAAISDIAEVYLVQKLCTHLPEQLSYVVGFTINNKWLGGRDRKIASAMAALRAHVSFPRHTMIIAFDAGNQAYQKRMALIAGSRLQ